MDNKKSDTKDRWKIQTAAANGNTLTYNQCELIADIDPMFIMFIDKFGITLRYNKSNVVSMELVK